MYGEARTRSAAIILLVIAASAPLFADAAWFSPRPPDPTPVERLDLSVPNYAWWHGCSPTSAGMLMGYYDRIAKGGLNRLAYGYTAPSENWKWSIWYFDYVVDEDSRANDLIDELGDFMHTNPEGGTPMDQIPGGLEGQALSYNLGADATNYYRSYGGFSFDDYVAEIRAGRPVLFHVARGTDAHTMTGIGYDIREGRHNIVFHDTWEYDENWMDWNGTYSANGGGWEIYAVTPVRFLLPEFSVAGPNLTHPEPARYEVNFGNRLVDAFQTLSESVTIKNTGGMDLSMHTTANEPSYHLRTGIGTPDWTLQRNQERDLVFNFEAVQRGLLTAEVTFDDTSNLGLGDKYLLATFNGVAPQASFDGVVDAGPVRIGTTAALDFTVSNVGDGNLSGQLPELSNLHGSVDGSSGSFVGAGGLVDLGDGLSETFEYLYTPTEHASDVADVAYAFSNGRQDGTNLPFAGSVQLQGIGVGPVYASSYASGSAIQFGDVTIGTSSWLPLEIANVSTDDVGISPQTDMTILDAIISGPDSSLFSLLDFTPGTVLHQSDGADFVFEFSPTSATGSMWANITFLTDVGAELGSPGASFSYSLLGVAIPEPSALVLLVSGALILFSFGWQRGVRLPHPPVRHVEVA